MTQLDGSGLFQQIQNMRTNSLEQEPKQYSIQKKNVVYRPPSGAVSSSLDKQQQPYGNKNQLRLKVVPKGSTIEKGHELDRRPQANSQLSHMSQNSNKEQSRQGGIGVNNSYQNKDVLIFPPRMIKQPHQGGNYSKNDMNASAPLNIQSLKAPQEYDPSI